MIRWQHAVALGTATFFLLLFLGIAVLRLAFPPRPLLCPAPTTVLESGANGRDRGAPRHRDP